MDRNMWPADVSSHTNTWVECSIYTPGCKSPFISHHIALPLGCMYICAALGVDSSLWFALLSSVKLSLRSNINQVCLCTLGRLSSSGYGNQLDCCPTSETETLNGAKDGAFSSALFLWFSLLEPRFIHPSRVVRWKKKKKRVQFRLFPDIHSCGFGGWIYA